MRRLRLDARIALALDYAHRRDILHRDIKPENILLLDGHAHRRDFGIARAISRATHGVAAHRDRVHARHAGLHESGAGAPATSEIDGRSDVYALGCVLHEMLTGSPPYTGARSRAIVMRHLTGSSSAPERRAQGDRFASIDAIVMRALAKEPSDRFATGGRARAGAHQRSRSGRSWRVRPFAGCGNRETSWPAAISRLHRGSAVREHERRSGQRVFLGRDHRGDHRSARRRFAACGDGAHVGHALQEDATARARHRPRARRVASAQREACAGRRDRVRIVAQLIDAATDEHSWAETYDCDITTSSRSRVRSRSRSPSGCRRASRPASARAS